VGVICLTANAETAGAAAEEPEDSLWPTPRQIELLTERIMEEHCLRYGFDQQQRKLFRERFAKIVPALMGKHRKAMEPVLMDVLVQHVSGEIPKAEQMAEWSQKVLPVVKEGMQEWDAVYQSMQPHLRRDQRKRWGRDHFMFKMGFNLAEAKLRDFARGNFDPSKWHDIMPGPHQRADEVLSQAKDAGMNTTPPPSLLGSAVGGVGAGRPPGPMAGAPGRTKSVRPSEAYVPLDRWQGYTQTFIKRHQLDEGQKTSAMAILREMRTRAKKYGDGRAAERARLKKLHGKSSGADRAAAKAELDRLEGPLRELFEEFRTRLNQLLTESQRELIAPAR